jgi:hypothetical protein
MKKFLTYLLDTEEPLGDVLAVLVVAIFTIIWILL